MDKKEIREKLKNSLDMVSVRMYLFIAGILALATAVIVLLFSPRSLSGPYKWMSLAFLLALYVAPFLIFCAWRTVSIFRCPESYHFCKTKLCNPKGGRIRDTIRFLVCWRMRADLNSPPTPIPFSIPTGAPPDWLSKIM